MLSDVNFDLAEGEILGLVGENGAGKTTLMHILFGMPVIADTGASRGKSSSKASLSIFQSLRRPGRRHRHGPPGVQLIPGFTTAENIVLNRESMRPGLLNDVLSATG